MKTFLAVSLLIFLFSFHLASATRSSPLGRWATASQISPLWVSLIDTSKFENDQVILEGSFELDVPQSASHFSKDFFLSIKNLEILSGADYEALAKPNMFRTKFSPTLFKKVTATTSILFLEDKDFLKTSLSSETDAIADDSLAVFQDSADFSDYFERSLLLTIIKPTGEGSSHITVAYLAVLNKSMTHSRLLGITKSGVFAQLQVRQQKSSDYFTNLKITP